MEKNLIERALELAATGEYGRIDHIERKLTAEGYTNVAAYLDGRSLRRQLRELSREARGEPPPKRRGRSPASHAPVD